MHAALAAIPLDAKNTQVREIVFLHARILGNDESEAVAAVTAVRSVLGHPFMTRARDAAGKDSAGVRRQSPLRLPTEPWSRGF